jgi:hypothetical protein
MLPADFWTNERQRLLAILRPALEAIAVAGANAGDRKLRNLGLIFDNELAHAEAARWARNYTDSLLEQFGTTTQRGVGEVIASWAETPGSTSGDLIERLKPFLGNNVARADLVSVTETTRAFAQGESIVYQRVGAGRMVFSPPGHPGCRCWSNMKRVRSDGSLVAVWQTNRDDLVCKRKIETPWGFVNGCRELQGTIISEGPYLGQKFSEASNG